MNKISFQNCRLYVIVDRQTIGSKDPLRVAEAAIRGGADLIQWRDKTSPDGEFLKLARELRKLTRRLAVPLVVNDRVDAALLAKADAVHLGHEDLPVREVRAWVGKTLKIGRSTHSLQEALQAQQDGADYIGVGPIFATPTKPTYPPVGLTLVAQVCSRIQIPWFAIGGIDFENMSEVLSAGATRIAVVRAVVCTRSPKHAAASLRRKLYLP